MTFAGESRPASHKLGADEIWDTEDRSAAKQKNARSDSDASMVEDSLSRDEEVSQDSFRSAWSPEKVRRAAWLVKQDADISCTIVLDRMTPWQQLPELYLAVLLWQISEGDEGQAEEVLEQDAGGHDSDEDKPPEKRRRGSGHLHTASPPFQQAVRSHCHCFLNVTA